MTQKRPPPAYQEYAASMLANVRFREMPLAARGLLYTLRLECWENHQLPSEPKRLAAVLRIDEPQVAEMLAYLDTFFRSDDGWLSCPELVNYRAHLNERHMKKSVGGRQGAAITNAKLGRVTRQHTRDSLAEDSTEETNTEKDNSVNKEAVMLDESWLSDYESASSVDGNSIRARSSDYDV